MARVIIEDCWWGDLRREALAKFLGSYDRADLAMVKAWRVSQDYWKREKQLVPIETFKLIEGSEEIIRAQLADVQGEFVYVKGSAERHDWIAQLVAGGRAGGMKSAQRSRNERGQLLPKIDQEEPKPNPSLDQASTKPEPGPSNVIIPIPIPITIPINIKKEEEYTHTHKPDTHLESFNEIWLVFNVGYRGRAQKYFENYIKPSEFKEFKQAVNHYLEDSKRQRRKLMHLSTFIGTSRSTHIWRDFLTMPDSNSSTNRIQEKLDEQQDFYERQRQQILSGEI